MVRSAVTCAVVLSLGIAISAATACANSPSDDLGPAGTEKSVAPTESGAKLPPPSSTTPDSGKDAATGSSGSSGTSGTSGTSGASGTSGTSGTSGSGTDCDLSTFLLNLKYGGEALDSTTPCPCSAASQCCYAGLVCVAK